MIDDQTKRLLHEIAVTVISKAREESPEVTGKLRASIDIVKEQKNFVKVGHKANPNIVINTSFGKVTYPELVHEGTGLYGKKKRKIRSKKTKALKTPYGLKKSIKGQKPNRYFDRAKLSALSSVEKTCSKYAQQIGEEVLEAFKRIV